MISLKRRKMKRIELNPIPCPVRCLLLVGILTGIFFSSGEGVRLLPFPEPLANPEKHSSIKTRKAGTYNFSVHNSTNLHSKTLKTQRNLKCEIGCAFYSLRESRPADFSALASIQIEEQAQGANSFGFLDSSFNRGPPTS